MGGQSIIYGDDSKNLYPAGRILINNVDNAREFIVTKECENNPALLLTIMYGATASAFADIFFAANHITDPYTQLTEGRAVKYIDIESMSALTADAQSTNQASATVKVKHAKVSNDKVTF